MSAIQPFAFEDHLVRVVMVDGEPWWVLADVCTVLGIANPSQAAGRLPPDEVSTLCFTEGHGGPERNIVSEPGLYRLIFRSNKPAAQRFQHWVFHDVLPTIRKTGRYSTEAAAPGDDLGPLSDLSTRCRMVEIAERISGKAAARALWRTLGLPWLPDMEAPAATAARPEIGEIGRFVAERLVRATGVITPAATLWAAYLDWCAQEDIGPATQSLFGRRLPGFGFPKVKASRIAYRDVRLKAQHDAGTAE